MHAHTIESIIGAIKEYREGSESSDDRQEAKERRKKREELMERLVNHITDLNADP